MSIQVTSHLFIYFLPFISNLSNLSIIIIINIFIRCYSTTLNVRIFKQTKTGIEEIISIVQCILKRSNAKGNFISDGVFVGY